MNYDNLWGLSDESVFEGLKLTDNIVEIMKQQCDYLKGSTNGKVFAKFAKIKMINPTFASRTAFANVATVVTALSPREVVGNSDNINLEDANKLYQNPRYGFEIYNQSYKFRVFELQMEPVYPVTITIDEGVNDAVRDDLCKKVLETDCINKYQISSDGMFIDAISIILKSRKVQFIVFRMKEV